jgi:hypothetical protein
MIPTESAITRHLLHEADVVVLGQLPVCFQIRARVLRHAME